MIRAEKLTKSYGEIEVLKGIDLHIQQGEIVSITGKSGAGKSTLLHILGTLDRADSGSLVIQNQPLQSMKEKELAKFRNAHIGFVFQFHHLLQEFTALENVCIPAYIQGKYGNDTVKRASELLSYFGLEGREQHKPSQLSGGEAQRVAVARALINQPSVVLADEPTGNLDKASSETLHELFLQLRKDFRQTFVIVTHNPELALLADRNLHMEDGHILQP
ncbi:MAG: ABC transporter ATP-binding protein [Saprospiraceae bacterium]|jgi:lipoprotein-releasing system ATP-binding protein|nr:ABC transporter ATP-binding protein [Saprospiraceae bacterium]